MGCSCAHLFPQTEMKNEVQEQYQQNQDNGRVFSEVDILKGANGLNNENNDLYRSNNEENELINSFQFIKTDKITKEELENLCSSNPPLNDGIEVEIRDPVESRNNKIIYYVEWDKNKNIRHGRRKFC